MLNNLDEDNKLTDLEKYERLNKELKKALQNVWKSLDNGGDVEEKITIGINGVGYEFYMCADLYDEMERFLDNMIKMEKE